LPGGDIIALSPPLSITKEEVDVVVERLRDALDEVATKQ
jgi:adenosylmethionine-8-amino-7-oxononanoate aminotransferase